MPTALGGVFGHHCVRGWQPRLSPPQVEQPDLDAGLAQLTMSGGVQPGGPLE